MTVPVERVRDFHRKVLFFCALTLVGGSGAAFYVAFINRSSDLPSWVYRGAGLLGPRGAGAGAAALGGAGFSAPPPPEILRWRPWDAASLEEARSQDKLVLLDLRAAWCRPCAQMDAQTYRDPAVADWVSANVVPVRVDTDEHPELTVRYLSGGWPTTALLLPTGEVLSSGTFMPSAPFLRWARQLVRAYRDGKADILEQRKQVRRAADQGHKERLRVAAPDPAQVSQGVEALRWDLSRRLDPESGGFGRTAKFPSSDPVRFLLALSAGGAADVERMLRSTLDGELRLMDPVWGGVFRYSTTPDWRSPSTEKLLSLQADLLRDFSEAYAATGASSYRQAAERLKRYMERFLADPEGGFRASQAADLVRGDGARMTGTAYYALSEPARLAAGVPGVDPRRPADGNAKAALGLLAEARALGDVEASSAALRALDRLWESADEEGALPHLAGDGAEGLKGWAEDEVLGARAMLEAYLATGEERYLERSRKLWRFIETRLKAKGGSPLMEAPAAPAGLDTSLSPYATALAAETAQAFFDLTLEPSFGDRADRLFAWCVTHGDLLDPTVLGRLAVRSRAKPEVVFLSGAGAEREAFAAAFGRLPSPRKYLVDAQARSFRRPRPSLAAPGPGAWAAVCSGAACRDAVTDPDRLADGLTASR